MDRKRGPFLLVYSDEKHRPVLPMQKFSPAKMGISKKATRKTIRIISLTSFIGGILTFMPFVLPHKGSWFGLPDFGISEKIQSFAKPQTQYTSQGGSNLVGPQQAYTPTTSGSVLGSSNQQYGPFLPSTNQPTTGGGGGGGGFSGGNAGTGILQNNINQQVQDLGAIIDNDYNVAMSGLQAQEESLKGQAGVAEQKIQSEGTAAQNEVTNQQGIREQDLAEQTQYAQTQEKKGVQGARDLFREIQQQNIAQLSGLGISSSSVSEALAERLGVETARRIAGVTGSTQEVITNIQKEAGRVKEFFGSKMIEIKNSVQDNIAQIQQSLMAGISQINQAKQMAAADKANRRAELLSNAQNAIAQLQFQAQQFQQSLAQWQSQKQASLQEASRFVLSPTDFSGQENWINKVGQLPQVAGFAAIPTFDQGSQGLIPGYKYQKLKQDEQPPNEQPPIQNPFLSG